MPWIPEDQMADIHVIRQEYGKAVAAVKDDPSAVNQAKLADVVDRRARAIRMVHEEDNMPVRFLTSMFRVNRATIREALEGGE